jgi:IclR family acetate operon transcriptional repressor
MTVSPGSADDRSAGGIQSIARVFSVLEAMADAGGVASVSSLAEISGLPLPTIHRLLRTLVSLGYARQEPSRVYALGPRLVRLGDAAERLLEAWATPPLRRLAATVGETASFAILDGKSVVYGAQASGRQSMHVVTEVGQRAGIHCTAVGKAILASFDPNRAEKIVADIDFRAYTDRTITSADTLLREVAGVRERGYATEIGEQEIGVTAVAVALPGLPGRGAVSVAGPSARIGDEIIRLAVPQLVNTARELASELEHMTY